MKLETTEEVYGQVTLHKEKLVEARNSLPWRNMKRVEVYSKF